MAGAVFSKWRDRAGQRLLGSVSALLIVVAANGFLVTPARARPVDSRGLRNMQKPASEAVKWETRIQSSGEIWVSLSNLGLLGSGHDAADPQVVSSPRVEQQLLGINWIPSFEFPSRSRNDYLYTAGLWFGCVRGADTLVSALTWRGPGASGEFEPTSLFELASSNPASPHYSATARADQQLAVTYADTAASIALRNIDRVESRRHLPIGLAIRQTSYTWATPVSRRFVIVDLWIKNTSDRAIGHGVVGMHVDGDVYNGLFTDRSGSEDDISGFLAVVPGIVEGSIDTVNVAWTADNDGDPFPGSGFRNENPSGVMAMRILRAPRGGQLSFNWWAYLWSDGRTPVVNWGPSMRANGTVYGLTSHGAPIGDNARFRMLRNHEIDYDQVYAAVNQQLRGWAPPLSKDAEAIDVANGLDTRFLLSYGPFDPIAPGDSVPFTYALIAGGNLHTDPQNFSLRFDHRNPKPYMDNLDFSDLIDNARWADWYFDTPGIDTDGDGNRGRAYLVNCRGGRCDSIFYKGDGVPDFGGPQSPYSPAITTTSRPGRVIVRWNGSVTETAIDPFSGKRDFEGYRVYAGLFDVNEQYSLLASWDFVDFKRFAYDRDEQAWVQISDPYTVAEWQEILGNPGFNPSDYPRPSFESAYVDTVTDTIRNLNGDIVRITRQERQSYWAREDYNRENEYYEADRWTQNLIQRVEERDTVIDDEHLTYGVYEITIDNLNPAVPLFFSVTAFDFGDYELGLAPLESPPGGNGVYAQPIHSSDVVVDSALNVSVYPNPYKAFYLDNEGRRTTYYDEGYEGRGVVDFVEQDRRIHFINLPDTATITIYSLDGDLIRRIHHPDPYLTTYSSVVGWDLITRNTQAVVSGIYIWKVDSKLGSQTGKLVIIK
jgi:hypothetical protein